MMKLQNNVRFHMLPTTGRSAEVLARKHGYKNTAALASSLPLRAHVLDVGAGTSPLGAEVARLRPDIHWTNLDYNYHDSRIMKDVSRYAPPNLAFIAGDATKLDEYIKPGSMDAVFSYWLFPHLSLNGEEVVLTAAKQLYVTTKQGGMLAVGPRRQPAFHPESILGRSWRVSKGGESTADGYSRELLRLTRLSAVNRYIRRAFDTAAFELFGTSRYLQGNNIITRRLYSPMTGVYLPLYDPRAVYLAAKLYAGTVARIFLPRH